MSDTQPSGRDLGNIITNTRARKAIYGAYVITCLVTTAVQVALASVQIPQPAPLSAGIAVLAYLAIPVGGLALANTARTAPKRSPRTPDPQSVRSLEASDVTYSVPVTGR